MSLLKYMIGTSIGGSYVIAQKFELWVNSLQAFRSKAEKFVKCEKPFMKIVDM